MRKRTPGATGIPLPLVWPWPGRGLSTSPGEPQVQLSLRASVPGVGAVGLCPGVPLGGASSVTAEAARAVERTVLEGKGFLNRRVFSARFQPGPCLTLQPELAPSWNWVPSVRPDFEAESAQTCSQVRELPLDAAAVQAAGIHRGWHPSRRVCGRGHFG